ncbi:MAG: 23S rRNA (guanosine(2251)-2'-O)-methyltransferase RlmB [Clostridia bacterium]|nr:23S rRNA (guanosine(2251)-2'-O)-methyltransferase RlmB [Clostridia bacterium]
MQIEGKNQVRELLNSDKTIEKISVLDGTRDDDVRTLSRFAKERGAKIEYLDKRAMDKLSITSHHQGIIATVTEFKYAELDDVIAAAKAKEEELFFIILDGVSDPHNLGSVMRVAECAGVTGIIIPKNRAVSVNETVVRVSAGASEHVNVIKVTNINKTIDDLKAQGVFVYAADMDGEEMYKTNLKGDIGIVVGSEGFGVSALTRKTCDGIISIPMFGKVNSLNASVSAGIVTYEAVRQRRK